MLMKKHMYGAFLLLFLKGPFLSVHGESNKLERSDFLYLFKRGEVCNGTNCWKWEICHTTRSEGLTRKRCVLPCDTDKECGFGYYCDKPSIISKGGCLPLTTFYLSQSDFDEGTYRITSPGKYVLTEDISFAPNSANISQSYDPSAVMDCCKPKPTQYVSNGGTYPDKPYSLGFFAAITVETKHVHIHLNGKTIEQSKEHALMQRFFAVIELASTPFIPKQGPADFGPSINAGRHVRIGGGTIGRSAHHGIHGNCNYDVAITNVKFEDFEVAAVALNGVNGLVVRNCSAKGRMDVPVMGRFSGMLFIYRYVKALVEDNAKTTLTVGGKEMTATFIKSKLDEAIVNIYEDIVVNERKTIDKEKHPDEYAIFHNAKGMVDGNAYGFLLHSLGAAVFGFPWTKDEGSKFYHSKNVEFDSVTVHDLRAEIDEVVALRRADIGWVVNDALGNVLQIWNVHPDDKKLITVTSNDDDKAEYKGNMVADAQLFVAKCIQEGTVPDDLHLPKKTNTINADVIAWAEAAATDKPERILSNLLSKLNPNSEDVPYYCDGDTMFHVNKGIIGFKIDNTDGATLKNCHVVNMVNHGASGSIMCGKYYRSHPLDTISGYGGADVRGFTFAGSRNVLVKDSTVSKLTSHHGCAVGYSVMMDSSNIKLESCTVDTVEAVENTETSPQTVYDGCGFEFGVASKDCALKDYCVTTTSSKFGRSLKIMDGGRGNKVENEMCKVI